jgi:ABC-type antimicrobial peptide transport system permease subunit
MHALDAKGAMQPIGRGTFVVRSRTANPLAVAAGLRQEVIRNGPAIYISNIRTQSEITLSRTVRERLLSLLARFFAAVAILLAGLGLYGVLDYGVLQRRREIGIRLAVGAQAADIARRVLSEALSMVCLGAIAGIALGLVSVRYIAALLYEIKGTEANLLIVPCLTLFAAASLAALPAVIRALRINPVEMLRAD